VFICYYVEYRLENTIGWGNMMKNLFTTVLVIFVGSQTVASGLAEPEIISPLVRLNVPCEATYTATEADYRRAFNHFTLAVGQSGAVAEKSARNMVMSHLAARKQTCNANAKAATNNSGNIIRDGLGGIVLNNP
jgi:hypothetical protein